MPKVKRNRFPGLRFASETGADDSCTKRSYLEFAEDKAVYLNYTQKKIDLPASVKSTFLMVFSPDGQRVASTHGDHRIYISEVKSGQMTQTLEGHPRTPWCLAFHPTLRNVVASGCLAGEVRVWDLHSGACEVWVNAHGSVIASLAFHPVDHVILIATSNELHFWDWRQSGEPFLTLTTSSEKEKVRYVKFDNLGSKIITGISNMPPVRSSMTYNMSLPQHTPGLSRTQSSDSLSDTESSGSSPSTPASLAARRSNLLSRVVTMYRQLDGLDEPASGSSEPSSSHSQLIRRNERLEQLISQSQRTEGSSASFNSLVDRVRSERDLARLDMARNYAAQVTSSASASQPLASASAIRDPTNDPMISGLSSSGSSAALDHSNNLMSTFRRLHSLCSRLAQLMQEQQQSPGLSERSRDVRNIEASTSLNDLLSRLQQSLQNMSTAAMTTAIAQEHIQQVRQRVAEILERLVNVSGYRARLSNLRDQIYEVAERIAAGSEPELGGTQRWDLIHCLWLVDMSIHLTRQMQRILAADYRLTQLTLSNTQTSSTVSSTLAPTTSSTDPTTPEPQANTSSGLSRFHPYSRWMIRSRNAPATVTSASADDEAVTAAMSSAIQRYRDRRDSSSYTIPLVRISSANDDEDVQDLNLPPVARERPRSPPMPEIQQVLNSISSSSSAASERFNFAAAAERRQSAALGSGPPPLAHLWFPGISGWGGVSGTGAEFGLLHGPNIHYRIQCWDFSKLTLPNLKDAHTNLVVSKCRIHNDASVDISADGNLLAALIPVDSSHSVNLCVYSLGKVTLGQCLYVWTFGANAISVALSPLSRYVVVGLTSPRTPQMYSYPPSTESATVAQVLKLSGRSKAALPCFEHVRNIDVQRGDDFFSLNSIRWLPGSGEGLIYGTNRGHLIVCRPNAMDAEALHNRQKSTGFHHGISSIIRNNSATTGTQTSSVSASRANRTLSIGTQTIDGPSNS
ncbi:Activating molecule in BECN1-regulated autophagy protein 1 [Halotydeus destructor]|nr:Activating molecule in BECN1-regulated autophagy protein 1 [Halotydeus destructor]